MREVVVLCPDTVFCGLWFTFSMLLVSEDISILSFPPVTLCYNLTSVYPTLTISVTQSLASTKHILHSCEYPNPTNSFAMHTPSLSLQNCLILQINDHKWSIAFTFSQMVHIYSWSHHLLIVRAILPYANMALGRWAHLAIGVLPIPRTWVSCPFYQTNCKL